MSTKKISKSVVRGDLMKKMIILILIIAIIILLTGCNMQIIDTKWAFHKAVINLNGKCFEVDVKSWKDYNDRAIQIIDNNGNVYYTSLNNVLLIGK